MRASTPGLRLMAHSAPSAGQLGVWWQGLAARERRWVSLALLLVIYVTMLGVAVGVRDAGHIGLESMLLLAPDSLRLKMEYLIHFLIGVFGAAMSWNCAFLAMSVWGYRLPTLWISEGWRYVPAAVAGVLIVMFSIEHIIALAKGREVEPAWA